MKLQRKDEIIRLAAENRVIKANELSELFRVSMETICQKSGLQKAKSLQSFSMCPWKPYAGI